LLFVSFFFLYIFKFCLPFLSCPLASFYWKYAKCAVPLVVHQFFEKKMFLFKTSFPLTQLCAVQCRKCRRGNDRNRGTQKRERKTGKARLFLFFQIVNPTRLGFLKVKLTIGGSLDELEGCKK
jgi:hypothetical protein